MAPKAKAHLLLPSPEERALVEQVGHLRQIVEAQAHALRHYDQQIDNLLGYINNTFIGFNYNFSVVGNHEEQVEKYIADICEQIGLPAPVFTRPELPVEDDGDDDGGTPGDEGEGASTDSGENGDVSDTTSG